jgi:hypothetical protein
MAAGGPPPLLQGLLGLPGDVHACIAQCCAFKDHLMLMSTSLAARRALGILVYRIRVMSRREIAVESMAGLLRHLPELLALGCYDVLEEPEGLAAAALAHAVAGGGCCQRLEELAVHCSMTAEQTESLGAAIATGNLPSLKKIECSHGPANVLAALSAGLRGGASPRLDDLLCDVHREAVGSLAEALKAREELGCQRIICLMLRLADGDDSSDGEDEDYGGEEIRRLLSAPALGELKYLNLSGLVSDDEVSIF